MIFGFDEYAEIHGFINGQWQLNKTLQPKDVSVINDTEFGKSVSIHNNWAGVGAFHDNDNGKWFAGAAYVFQNNNGDWQESQKLLLSDGEAGDFFGFELNNRNNQFIISAASFRNINTFFFQPNREGMWQEFDLIGNTTGILHTNTKSLDHAVTCNQDNNGTCIVFITPLFKSDFEQTPNISQFIE